MRTQDASRLGGGWGGCTYKSGHAREDGWVESADVVQQLRGVALVEADTRAIVKQRLLHNALEHVCQGEVADVHVVLAGVDTSGNGSQHVSNDVVVGQHGALGVAGRAAGVAERGNSGGVDLRGVRRVRLACFLDLRELPDVQVVLGLGLVLATPLLVGGGVGSGHDDDVEKAPALRRNIQHRRHLGSGADDSAQLRLVDDVLHRGGTQGVVQRHDDDAELVASLRGDDPLLAVLGVEADEAHALGLRVVAGRREVKVHHPGAEVLHAGLHLVVRLPHVRTGLAIRTHRTVAKARLVLRHGPALHEVVVQSLDRASGDHGHRALVARRGSIDGGVGHLAGVGSVAFHRTCMHIHTPPPCTRMLG